MWLRGVAHSLSCPGLGVPASLEWQQPEHAAEPGADQPAALFRRPPSSQGCVWLAPVQLGPVSAQGGQWVNGVPCGKKRDSEPHFSLGSGPESRVTTFGLIP